MSNQNIDPLPKIIFICFSLTKLSQNCVRRTENFFYVCWISTMGISKYWTVPFDFVLLYMIILGVVAKIMSWYFLYLFLQNCREQADRNMVLCKNGPIFFSPTFFERPKTSNIFFRFNETLVWLILQCHNK